MRPPGHRFLAVESIRPSPGPALTEPHFPFWAYGCVRRCGSHPRSEGGRHRCAASPGLGAGHVSVAGHRPPTGPDMRRVWPPANWNSSTSMTIPQVRLLPRCAIATRPRDRSARGLVGKRSGPLQLPFRSSLTTDDVCADPALPRSSLNATRTLISLAVDGVPPRAIVVDVSVPRAAIRAVPNTSTGESCAVVEEPDVSVRVAVTCVMVAPTPPVSRRTRGIPYENRRPSGRANVAVVVTSLMTMAAARPSGPVGLSQAATRVPAMTATAIAAPRARCRWRLMG